MFSWFLQVHLQTVQTSWCPWGRITAVQVFCAPFLLHHMFSGMQRCKLHPEKTQALCLKCAHLKGHGSSLCRCVYLRCTHATHSPHTYSSLSLLSLCSLSLSLSLPPSLPPFLPPSSALSLSPSVLLTSQVRSLEGRWVLAV